jgi:hypothetical protein
MKVYGELEVAQLEGFTTVNLPPANLNIRRICYDLTQNLVVYSDGVNWKSTISSTGQFEYSIGSLADSDFLTLAAALAAHPNNSTFILNPSYSTVENVTIAGNNIFIAGKGAVSVFAGNLTVSSQYVQIKSIKFTGDITLDAASVACEVSSCWMSSTSVLTDNGTNNFQQLIQN